MSKLLLTFLTGF